MPEFVTLAAIVGLLISIGLNLATRQYFNHRADTHEKNYRNPTE